MDRVILRYRHRRFDEPGKQEEYPAWLDWTPCNYGGSRPWFHCPARGCGRRVAILYGGGIFACRDCHQLAYESQREPNGRALSRAQAIREKLGRSASMSEDVPDEPRGMHWRTYNRLVLQYEEAQAFVAALVAAAGNGEREILSCPLCCGNGMKKSGEVFHVCFT